MQAQIVETGISVVYKPEHGSPVVDIVLVHGLQGHPYKTWTFTGSAKPSVPARFQPEIPTNGKERLKHKDFVRSLAPWLKRNSLDKPTSDTNSKLGVGLSAEGQNGQLSSVFWPADLLHYECPKSRVLMYGYDTKITKYMTGATNKNSIFSHSKDLLFTLRRVRNIDRPLIFVAHSLGGIVVKEMLARSSSSQEPELKNVIESTTAVIFLGTPHRGSPDLSALGEWARSIVSTLRMETTSAILDALGLRTTDLERAQESFSELWQRYDFRVKTFQEGLGLTGLNLGVLGNKVVPDYSSLIGDHRENAETIQANHMDMCRFTGPRDPNYRKIAGELHSIYRPIVGLRLQQVYEDGRLQGVRPTVGILSSSDSLERIYDGVFDKTEKACLQSLWFPAMMTRTQSFEQPAKQTGRWLFEDKTYLDWYNNRNTDAHAGLLWLKGKPGVGKSVLMKEAFRQAAQEQDKSNYWTAAFFFNAKGEELERTQIGLFRSLLYQLLPRYRKFLRTLGQIWSEKTLDFDDHGHPISCWQEAELKSYFEAMVFQRADKRILIFVDALDECDGHTLRPQVYFWREITKSAHSTEDHNSHDIATYVERKLEHGFGAEEREILKEKILRTSAGVFLWVVLVVNDVLEKWDEGKNLRFLLRQLDVVPTELQVLFSELLYSLVADAKPVALRLFHWAVLAAKPLRIHEWHHVLAFIRHPAPSSLHQWRASDHFTETDDQLEKQIRNLSKGLIEVKTTTEGPHVGNSDAMSLRAGAGSLEFDYGETRIVQVIHESVREFFLQSNGFLILGRSPELPVGDGHISIMNTCLDYLEIEELDTLVQARIEAQQPNLAPSVDHSFESDTFQDSNRNVNPSEFMSSQNDLNAYVIAQNQDLEAKNRGYSTYVDEIIQWQKTTQSLAEEFNPIGPGCRSPSQLSITGRSQRLQDYPALLSYATFELFTHAQLAEKEAADPSPIISRLQNEHTWARWLTLREYFDAEITLLDYANALGLSSWVHEISGICDATDCHHRGIKLSPTRKEAHPIFVNRIPVDTIPVVTSPVYPTQHKNRNKARNRSPSVASFGSAGSHTGV